MFEVSMPFLTRFSSLTRRVGIDLGTSRIRIWDDQKGLAIDEPACIAVEKQAQKIVAVGKEAAEMIGRSASSVEVIFPLQAGVMKNPELVEVMMRIFLQRVLRSTFFFRPLAVISVPSTLKEPDRDALTQLFFQLGFREVSFIDQCVAAAIGAGVPIADASGSFMIQMGASVVECGIISLGSLVAVESVFYGGNALIEDIKRFFQQQHSLEIGTKTAEKVLITMSAKESTTRTEQRFAGRDVVEEVPKEVTIELGTLQPLVVVASQKYVELIKKVFEKIPPELTNDVIDKGMLLSGGLAQNEVIEAFLVKEMGIPVTTIEEASRAVVRGIGQVLQNYDLFTQSLGYRHARSD